jgi:two-component system, sensor histidine kinase
MKRLVLIEVEDSGIGVPADRRDMLFKMFGQAQRRAGGTGLGLFSLHKRMEALGGRCGMCDRQDGSPGSCFWFCFPYVPGSEVDTRGLRLGGDSGGEDGSINTRTTRRDETSASYYCRDSGAVYGSCSGKMLLVDDSILITKTTSYMLRKLGFEVEVAPNGFDALNLMLENSYTFVLTDIQMPVMDGIEATRRLRAHEMECVQEGVSISAQFIIGMSADSDTETKREALQSGMNAFLSKPIHANELLKCLPHLRCCLGRKTEEVDIESA